MAKEIMVWQANDGSMHETEEAAIKQDESIKVTRYVEILTTVIIANTDIDYKRTIEQLNGGVFIVFSNKNTRNIIRKLLELTATDGND